MNRSTEMEVKVGIFVTLGVGLLMFAIILLGGGQAIFQRSIELKARFGQIEGLVEGANVKLAGIRVGQVSKITYMPAVNQVEITFSVAHKFKDSVRTDSTVGILTQGMLGDRFLVINNNGTSSPVVKNGDELKAEAPKELKDYLSDADEVLDKLKNSLVHLEGILGGFNRDGRADSFFRNLANLSSNVNDSTKGMRESMTHLKSIMTKIDNGEGTLGALVNDPAMYDDMRALLGGANRNRVLKYFIKKSVEESREASREEKK